MLFINNIPYQRQPKNKKYIFEPSRFGFLNIIDYYPHQVDKEKQNFKFLGLIVSEILTFKKVKTLATF